MMAMSRRNHDKLRNLNDKTAVNFTAKDVNDIQKVMNSTQNDINLLKDASFHDKALFVFDNSDMNGISFYEFTGYEKINRPKSTNVRYDNIVKAVKLRRPTEDGVLTCVPVESADPLLIDKVHLLSDCYIPDGARLEFFVSIDNMNFTPIKPNENNPKVFDKKGDSITIVVNMYPNAFGDSPEVYNYAILYYNEVIETLYGLKEIDFEDTSRPELGINEVYIIRDKDNKVTSILDDNSITRIGRNADQKVDSITSDNNDGTKEVTSIIREDVNGTEMVTRIKSERRRVENVEN